MEIILSGSPDLPSLRQPLEPLPKMKWHHNDSNDWPHQVTASILRSDERAGLCAGVCLPSDHHLGTLHTLLSLVHSRLRILN